MVTPAEVEAKAKELVLTLSKEQVAAHVTLNTLPSKDSPASKGKDDDDDDDTPRGVQKRINKLNQKHKDEIDKISGDAEATKKKLKEFEDAAKEKERKDLEDKGEHLKLAAKSKEEKEATERKLTAAKETLRKSGIANALKESLISQGVPIEKIDKALRLIGEGAVRFKWTDEEKLESSIDGAEASVETFKEEWPEFFGDPNLDDKPSSQRGPRPPVRRTADDKSGERMKNLIKSVPALGRLLPS